jgi:nucleoside-diphosphate-sugar epimerase
VTKRDTDLALAAVEGLTRVLLRPPAILGSGESSIWNAVRPAAIRDREAARRAVPQQTFAWVHVDDLAALAADVATGRVATASDPAQGPVDGGCTAVNVAAGPATVRDYYETVAAASASRRLGRRRGVDRSGARRARPRLGVGPGGRARPGARGAGPRAALA